MSFTYPNTGARPSRGLAALLSFPLLLSLAPLAHGKIDPWTLVYRSPAGDVAGFMRNPTERGRGRVLVEARLSFQEPRKMGDATVLRIEGEEEINCREASSRTVYMRLHGADGMVAQVAADERGWQPVAKNSFAAQLLARACRPLD